MLLEELVERTIFHALRKEVVSRGYLPDIESYDINNPNLATAKAENNRFNSDLAATALTKGFAIEVFNYSSTQAYGEKKVPRVVIETDSFIPGNLGTDPTGRYEKQVDGTFNKLKSIELVSDYYFSVYLVANTTRSIRELHDIMVNVLPRRGYIKRFDENELRPHSNLLIQYLSSADVSYLSEGIIEKVYKYMIPDVHEVDDKVVSIGLQPIVNITVDDIDENNILTVE